MRFAVCSLLAALFISGASAHTGGCTSGPGAQLCVTEDGNPGGTIHQFLHSIGAGNPTPIAATVTSTGAPLSFRAAVVAIDPPGVNWVTVSPSSGVTPATVLISLNPVFLSPGTGLGYTPYYTAQINFVTADGRLALDVYVGVGVTGNATLAFSPVSLNFTAVKGDPPPSSRNINLTTLGAASWRLKYYSNVSYASGAGWLSATPDTATTPSAMSVGVNHNALAAGVYNAVVSVSDTAGPINPPVVVNFRVEDALVVQQTSLRYNVRLGDTAPISQGVSVGSTGGPVPFTAAASGSSPFLNAQASAAVTNSVVNVIVNPVGLGLGTHTGSVRLASQSGLSVKFVEVTVNVTAPPLSASTNALTFRFTRGGPQPAPQTVNITSSAAGVPFTPSASASWVTVTSSSPVSPATLTVAVNPAGLNLGTSTANVVVATADSAPILIAVTLEVASSPLTVSSTSVSAQFRIGDTPPVAQAIQVTSDPPGASFTVTAPQAPWLEVSPLAGVTPAQVTFRFNVQNLAAGVYSAIVTIARGNLGSVQIQATCTVVATSEALAVSAARLEFAGEPRGTAPPAQTFTLDGLGRNVAFTAVAESEGSWLSVTPASGTTPSVETVRVSLANLLAGGHVGRLIFNVAGASPTIVEVRAKVGVIPEVADNAVVKALGSTPGPFAAGSLVTLFGRFPGLAMAVNSASTLPTALAGFTATAGGVATRPFFTSDAQVNLQLPFGLPLGRTTLIPAVNGVRGFPVNIEIVAAAPGLLTYPDGRRAIAQNQDYTLNARENPAPEGTVIVVYLTGQGDLNPPVATGAAAPADPLAIPRLEVRATIGGVPVRKVFGGMTPGFAGLMQGNFDTAGAPRGEQPIVVYINEVPSNAGMVYIGGN